MYLCTSMYVRMYVCMYVCMYVEMYVCMNLRRYLSKNVLCIVYILYMQTKRFRRKTAHTDQPTVLQYKSSVTQIKIFKI